jgi:hypothetical protein
VWIGVLFTQCMMDSPESQKIFTDFWTLAYEAMESEASAASSVAVPSEKT